MGILKGIDRLLYHCRPTACTLFMSSACNFRCPGCARAVVGSSGACGMTVPVVRRALEVYPELACFTLAGFGEPTLCSEFVEIVRFLAEKRRAVGVITNGTNIAPLLACEGLDLSLTISLYGYDRESYLSNTGQDVFPELLRTYARLAKRFRHVGFSLVVRRDNLSVLTRYLELFDKLSPAFVVLVNHLTYDVTDQDSCRKVLTVEDADVIETLRQQSRSRSYLKSLPVLIDPGRPRLRCRSYSYLINIDGDGNVGGCQRQIGPSAVFGNILTMPDPFNSSEMIQLRQRCGRRPLHEACRFCFGNWEKANWLTSLVRSKFGVFGKLDSRLRHRRARVR